jgi:hydroxymethylglutaryl-CoA lyase
MSGRYPEIVYTEEGMREGMQIEDANIPIDAKVALKVEGTIGGMGGCPYCGNGQATGMAATEDVMHMLEGMGIETGVNLDKLIECVWMCEEILGRHLWGHVSRTGPRPARVADLYDMKAPFVETLEQATYFKRGPEVYEEFFPKPC